jgi:hypothetical protein
MDLSLSYSSRLLLKIKNEARVDSCSILIHVCFDNGQQYTWEHAHISGVFHKAGFMT